MTLACLAACSQRSPRTIDDGPPAISREMRGIWIATVRNIDWPSTDTLSAERQRAELIDIYDRAVAAGFNTVVFQVRPATDAVYRSELEPWSVLLSGRQGTDPGYDPLEFAVTEAHARGLEIHAWINPFRAGMTVADTAALAPSHLWNTRRDLVRVYGTYLWLDPGESDAREHSMRVVTDIVRRYDIDGIHMDDYFYPYPVRDSVRGENIAFPDSASYARSGSTLSRDDWRRENIDRFVERMYCESHAIKPMIKVGISPFGIWRPGNPPSVAGFDAYASIYADARKWLQAGWVDYFVPQLYWAIAARQQSFPALFDWWLGENTLRRHIWPGLATYRSAARSNGFDRDEIASQVKLIRARPVPPGHVMFNTTTTLKRDNGVLATLRPLFPDRAVVPTFSWLDGTPPAAPTVAVSGRTLSISAAEKPRFWVVQSRQDGWLWRSSWTTRVASGDSTTLTLPDNATAVFVSALDHAGNLSPRQRVDVR
ncbi:MAG: glycoside hydrolase family 10 protein [Gemmatimonadaceae bacterium]